MAALADCAVMLLCVGTAAGCAFAFAAAAAAATPDGCEILPEATGAGPAASALFGAAAAAAPLTGMGAKTPTAAVALAAG
jgi:hypothetical protein